MRGGARPHELGALSACSKSNPVAPDSAAAGAPTAAVCGDKAADGSVVTAALYPTGH